MKRMQLMRCVGMVLLVLLGACAKQPLHPEVEGHWRLEAFTVLATQEVVEDQHLYYGITRMVTEVARKAGDEKDVSYLARTVYEEEGTVLVLSEFKVNGYNTDSGIEATPAQLAPFGIQNPQQTRFRIVRVDGTHLILESDYARLNLKRF